MMLPWLSWKTLWTVGFVASGLSSEALKAHASPDIGTPSSRLYSDGFSTLASSSLPTPSFITALKSSASTSTDYNQNLASRDSESDSEDDLCTSECSVCASNKLPSPSGDARKRSPDPSPLSLSLFERNLADPTDTSNYAEWLFNQLKKGTLVPKGRSDESTSWKEPLGNKPVNLGVINLYGCTSVVVISKKAIYASHFYQRWFAVGTTATTEQFKENVITWLKNDPKLDDPAFTEPGAAAHAIIIPPRASNGRDPKPEIRYQDRANEISEALGSKLALQKPAQKTGYINVRKKDISDEALQNGFSFAHGKVLVSYDPKVNDDCDVPGVKVWIGDTTNEIYATDW